MVFVAVKANDGAFARRELSKYRQPNARNGKACHYLLGAGRPDQDMLLNRQIHLSYLVYTQRQKEIL